MAGAASATSASRRGARRYRRRCGRATRNGLALAVPRDLSWPVWHLDKPLDYLDELADEWPGVCLGSAGAYWEIGSETWLQRMDDVFNHMHRRKRLPWLHGLRMLGHIGNYPLASADSTNVAQNYGVSTGCAHCMAKRVNSVKRKRGNSKRDLAPKLFADVI